MPFRETFGTVSTLPDNAAAAPNEAPKSLIDLVPLADRSRLGKQFWRPTSSPRSVGNAFGATWWPSAMASEDVVSESYTPRDDAETPGSGREEDRSGPAHKSVHDKGIDEALPRAQESDGEETPASPDGARAWGGAAPAQGAAAVPGSAGTSSWKKDKKKKGRGGVDGKPAMSIEDLFVTISTVQVGSTRDFSPDGATLCV